MNLIPVNVTPKTITNEEDIKDAINNKSNQKFNIRSDFVKQKDKHLSFDSTDDDIYDKIKKEIQDYCRLLPHSRVNLTIRCIEDVVEITINPLTCTA